MRTLSQTEMVGMAFPDCAVLSFGASSEAVAFVCDGIYLEGVGLLAEKADVVITQWRTSRVLRYSPDGRTSEEIRLELSGGLREICECRFGGNEVYFAGFERGGCWQEYLFVSPLVTVRMP